MELSQPYDFMARCHGQVAIRDVIEHDSEGEYGLQRPNSCVALMRLQPSPQHAPICQWNARDYVANLIQKPWTVNIRVEE
jgi:hypothetical protein